MRLTTTQITTLDEFGAGLDVLTLAVDDEGRLFALTAAEIKAGKHHVHPDQGQLKEG